MENKELKTPIHQREAVKRYLSKFVDLKIRISAEEREAIHNHAEIMSESTSSFVKRAIRETMERDKAR